MATRLYYSKNDGYYKPPISGLPKALDTSARFVPNHIPKMMPVRVPSTGGAWNVAADLTPSTLTPPTSLALTMFATAALAAGSISGTVKGQMRLMENTSVYDDTSEMWLFLIDSNWAYKAALMGPSGPSTVQSEWGPGSAINRRMPYGGAVNLTPQTAADGDRIIVMLGVKRFSIYGGNSPTFPNLSSTGVTDLPEDETTTTDLAPWLEFSQTLSFLSTDPAPTLSDTIEALGVGVEANNGTDLFIPAGVFGLTDEGVGTGGGAPVVPTTGQTWPRGK